MSSRRLDELRRKISEKNLEILELLNRRASTVLKVCEEKRLLEMEFHDPEREQQMIAELTALNQGPFTDEMITAVFQEVFRISRMLMEKHGHHE